MFKRQMVSEPLFFFLPLTIHEKGNVLLYKVIVSRRQRDGEKKRAQTEDVVRDM